MTTKDICPVQRDLSNHLADEAIAEKKDAFREDMIELIVRSLYSYGAYTIPGKGSYEWSDFQAWLYDDVDRATRFEFMVQSVSSPAAEGLDDTQCWFYASKLRKFIDESLHAYVETFVDVAVDYEETP